jgi:hypothetical protein
MLVASSALATAAPAKKTKAARKTKAHPTKQEPTDPSRLATPADATSQPAYRYGALTREACEQELVARQIGFERVADTAGVLAPVRLTGPLHGVTFRTSGTDKQRAASPYEIADCRLVLAMADLSEILAAHGIVEVRHYSMYRPPAKDWPADRVGTRHNGALALDAGRFTDGDGHTLDVDKDFHGAIDAKTCGPGAAPNPATPEAIELRTILCEVVDRHLFNVVLTPNYNKPHHNHFHLEVTAGVKWFLVH